MIRASLSIILVGLILGIIPYAEGLEGAYFDTTSLLFNRQKEWPNWHLPSSYSKGLKNQDLFYPDWFEGLWEVESIDLNDPDSKIIVHLANFFYDNNYSLIADRKFNAKSIGKVILGDELIDINDEQSSSNRQIALFKGGGFLDSKVIARNQNSNEENTFFSDEIAFHIFHQSNQVRINRVEILSKYEVCSNTKISYFDNRKAICGEQWEASYGESKHFFDSSPITTNHYKLKLYPIPLSSLKEIN